MSSIDHVYNLISVDGTVQVDNVKSCHHTVLRGIPQSSLLGSFIVQHFHQRYY